jgi:hypothetical protein
MGYLPGQLEQSIGEFVEYYNDRGRFRPSVAVAAKSNANELCGVSVTADGDCARGKVFP